MTSPRTASTGPGTRDTAISKLAYCGSEAGYRGLGEGSQDPGEDEHGG